MALDVRKKFVDFSLNLLSHDHLLGSIAFEEDVTAEAYKYV
jgi:hypothetical protein